jgi:hypothetical protein
MAEYVVGNASVLVTPSMKGFVSAIEDQCEKAGDAGGKIFADAFSARVGLGTKDAPIGPSDEDSTEKGSAAAGKFADAFKARLDAALKSLPNVKLDADSSDTDRKIAEIRAELLDLRSKKIGIDISDDEALAKIAVLKGALVTLGKSSESVSVRVNSGAALSELGAIGGAGGGAGSGISSLGSDAAGAGFSIGDVLVPALAALGVALVPIGGLALGALSTLPAALAGAATGFAAIKLGTSGVGAAIQDMAAALANPSWTNIAAIETALKGLSPAAATFVTGLQPLIKGFDDLKLVTQQALFSGLDAALPGLQNLFVTIEPFITQAATGIGKFVASLVGIVSSQTGLYEINGIFKAGAGFMGDLAKAALDLVPAFLTIGQEAGPILKDIGKGIESAAKSFAGWVANGGFQRFIEWVQKNGPGIVNVIETLAKAFGKIVVGIAPVGIALFKVIGVVGSFLGELGKLQIFTFIPIFGQLLYLALHWSQVFNAMKAVAETVWQFLENDILHPLADFFTQTIPHALSVFSGAITTGFQSVHDIVNTVWHAIDNDVFIPFVNFFTQTIPHALDTVVGFFSALPGRIISAVGDLAKAAFGTLENVASWVDTNIITPFVTEIAKLPGQIGDIGGKIVSGIVKGITDAAGDLARAVTSIIPHGTIHLGPVSIPYAQGGIISGPQHILAGEDGAEAILPLTKPQRMAEILQQIGPLLPQRSAPFTIPQMAAPVYALSGGSNGPVQHVDTQIINHPTDAVLMSQQLAFLRRAGRL